MAIIKQEKTAKTGETLVRAHTRKKNANRPKVYKNAMKVSKKALMEAAEKSNGIISLLSAQLRIDARTAKRYLDLVPEAKESFEIGRGVVLDKAESELLEIAFKKDHPRQFDALMFLLKTLGKTRGFTEKTETEIKTDQPVVIHLDADDIEKV